MQLGRAGQGQGRLAATLDAHALVGRHRDPGPDLAVGPGHAHLGRLGRTEPEVGRSQLARDVAAADGDLALLAAGVAADLDPGADRVTVGAVLGRLDGQPAAHRRGFRGRAGTGVAPDLCLVAQVDLDQVEQAVEVEVHERRTPRARIVGDAGSFSALDEVPVLTLQEQAARVLDGLVRQGIEVAL